MMRSLPALLLLAIAVWACHDEPRVVVQQQPVVPVETKIVAKQYLLDASALDLAAINGRLEEAGGVSDLGALEAWINSTPGVNNVDIDRDGQRDPITIKEAPDRETGKAVLALTALPATGEPVVAAELQVETVMEGGVQRTVVRSGYPEYVRGYEQHSYESSLRQAALAAWLFNATRPVYYHPPTYYRSYGWAAPAPVLAEERVRSVRRETTTTKRVAPVKRTSSTPAFKSRSAGAQKTAQKLAPRKTAPAATTSLKASSGAGASFTKRDSTKPKPKATNAVRGGLKPAPRAATTPSTTKSSFASSASVTNRPSRPVRTSSSRPSRPKRSSTKSKSTSKPKPRSRR